MVKTHICSNLQHTARQQQKIDSKLRDILVKLFNFTEKVLYIFRKVQEGRIG